MRIEPFALERLQSTYENEVEFNLSESGVHPLRLGELVHDTAARDALLAEALRYTQTNGTPAAARADRRHVYPARRPPISMVTNGGSEANFVATWNLVETGDEVVMMVPELHADVGPRARVRRDGHGMAARQRRRALAHGRRRV